LASLRQKHPDNTNRRISYDGWRS